MPCSSQFESLETQVSKVKVLSTLLILYLRAVWKVTPFLAGCQGWWKLGSGQQGEGGEGVGTSRLWGHSGLSAWVLQHLPSQNPAVTRATLHTMMHDNMLLVKGWPARSMSCPMGFVFQALAYQCILVCREAHFGSLASFSLGIAGSWNWSSALALAQKTGTMLWHLGGCISWLACLFAPLATWSCMAVCMVGPRYSRSNSVCFVLALIKAKYASCHQACSWVQNYVQQCSGYLAWMVWPPPFPGLKLRYP